MKIIYLNTKFLKTLFIFCVLLGFTQNSFAQNLLDTSTWVLEPGTGDIPGFTQFGNDSNNERLANEEKDPYGGDALLWKAKGPVSSAGQSGGWTSDPIIVPDNTKSYRFTVWVKKKGTLNINGNGKAWFGMGAGFREYGGLNARKLDDSQPSNSHFFSGFLPKIDKWYLLVGFVHGSDYAGTEIKGAIYDAETRDSIMPMQQEFKFSNNADKIWSKSFLFGEYYNENSLYIWNPSIYRTDDLTMPSIDELTAPSVAAAQSTGTSVWSTGTNGIYYDGNVGIGTADTKGSKLAVNGNIHAQEVKVDTEGWPDFVFETDYQLPSLEEVKKHIEEKGHLINIPSAKEVESTGVELGSMNKLLVEKIEELTLYILEQHQLNKDIKEKIELLEGQNQTIKN